MLKEKQDIGEARCIAFHQRQTLDIVLLRLSEKIKVEERWGREPLIYSRNDHMRC